MIIAPYEDKYFTLTLKIQQLLRANRLRSSPILFFQPELPKGLNLFSGSIIIFVIGETNYNGFSHIEEINELAKTVTIPPFVKVIKIFVKPQDVLFEDFVPSIQADGVINFSPNAVNNLHDLDKLIKNFTGDLMNT